MLPMDKGVESQAGATPRGNLDLEPTSSATNTTAESLLPKEETSSSSSSSSSSAGGVTRQQMVERLHAVEEQLRNESAQIERESKVNLSRWLLLVQEVS